MLSSLFALLVVAINVAYAGLAIADDSGANSDFTAQLDTHFNALSNKGFSGGVLVAKGGEVILAKGYGYANIEQQIPNTPDTPFDMGSITKPFSGAAVVKLKSDGKLSFDDPIRKYFDDVPEDKAAITIHHLLTHTAGFPDGLGADYRKIGRDEFVSLALDSELRFEPGDRYAYSNVGYSLLGAIIEKVTRQSYETYLHETLFQPAGMAQTGYVIPEWDETAVARGYRRGRLWGSPLDKPWAEDGPWWHLRANGGLLTTLNDLHRWAVALRNNTVLSEEATAAHLNPYVSEGGRTSYSYGWSIRPLPGETRAVEHNGGNGIFFADLHIYPDHDAVLILFMNASDPRYEDALYDIERIVIPELDS